MLPLAAFVVACNRPPSQAPARPTPGIVIAPPPEPATLESIFILESGGPPPDDTTVVAPAGRPRVIVLRRGAPDNSLFASVAISDSVLGDSTAAPRPGDSVTVRISPRPGIYGLDVEVDGGDPGPIRVAMSYAVHFVAPAGARDRYGSDLDFEQALFLARVEPDGRVVFLPTVRAGSDLLSARVPGPGRYVVAAPRR